MHNHFPPRCNTKQALNGISLHTAEPELIVTAEEAQLTSGRTDVSVLSLPVLPVQGMHIQGDSVQKPLTNFGSVSGKT